MAQCSDERNRLQRDGTSQSQRRLAALDPASAPVDQRGVEDFLVFALRFASYVKHFDEDDRQGQEGTWESFFACDASALIAAIEKTNPRPIRDAVRATLEAVPEPAALARLFELLGDLALRLEDWQRGVGTATEFRDQIRKRIRANLATPLCRLIGYNLAAASRFDAVAELDFTGFSEAWSVALCEAAPDDSLFTGAGSEEQQIADGSLLAGADREARQIAAALGRLETLFAAFYSVLVEVIGLAPRYFDDDLDGRSDHEPHFALFVAFLRLYLLVRDDANKLTQKHLDFFYQKVLGIEKRAPDPDHLHVVVELARQVKDDHRIATKTELDAGKDDTGVALRYALDEDLVANKAQVESFKTVFVVYDREALDFPQKRVIKNVTAAPIANSQDGLGAELEDTERPSWPTLGSAGMPDARIGFALASRALLLAEGKRTITLSLEAKSLPDELTTEAIETAFEVLLSGEKGWIKPDGVKPKIIAAPVNTGAGVSVRGGTLELTITLEKKNDAVTSADKEVLGEDFGTTLPVLKVTLRHPAASEAAVYPYGLLKDLTLEKVTLETDVEDLTDVIVQNDAFAMDPSKPFTPFGPSPRVGSSFYVGSREAFQKNLTQVTLNVTWDLLPDEPFTTYYEAYDVASDKLALSKFTVAAQVLQDGLWNEVEPSLVDSRLFGGVAGKAPAGERDLVIEGLGKQAPRVIDELTEWKPATRHGFLRLTLDGQAFFHDVYVNVLTRQTLAAARMPDATSGALYRVRAAAGDQNYVVKGCPNSESPACGHPVDPTKVEVILPNAPYTPTIKAFSLDYEASIDTESSPEHFELFHVEPFGLRRVAAPAGEKQPHLLPQYDQEGTLFVGVKDLEPLDSLSVLFQVAEATADTDVPKPDVSWAYLADDEWLDFEEHEITADATRGLITSGVVTFKIPRAVTSKNTRLPSGLHWLRAAVAVGAGGVSELIDAHAQAVRATFVDRGNDPHHLEVPLEAGKVSGLVRDDAKVAGVEQPYDSFGARPAESGLAFYTRVAEHLRHKGRAITLFDYERLVLESFPGIYKVKCINHTDRQPAERPGGDDVHSLAPGHVLIAVVPDFTKLKAVDRRRPKVTLDELDEIATFLQSINCPFARNDRSDGRARLHVVNPIYEEVRVAFGVRFRPEVSAVSFHKRLLNEAINRFLSPWAFEDAADVAFGGRVYKSSILNFVEEQTYVDYVTDFVMTHRGGTEDLDAIEADTPRSILVPAEEHGIETDPLCVMTQEIPLKNEIGSLTVGQDFEVAEEKS